VIPTYGRAQWLGEAIASCFKVRPDPADVEVVVGVNGTRPDGIAELCAWDRHPSVHVVHTDVKSANVGRNLGMSIARGRYLKFLDDDDFLLAEGTNEQIRVLESTNADVCSGSAEVVDQDGVLMSIYEQPRDMPFAEAVLSGSIVALPFTHCFRRASLAGLRWDEDCNLAHDHLVLYRWLRERSPAWEVTPARVGAWRSHTVGRQSSLEPGHLIKRAHVDGILAAAHAMSEQGRLTPSCRQAAARGLWLNLHPIFERDSFWALYAAREALRLDPLARPSSGRAWADPLFQAFPITASVVWGAMRWMRSRLRAGAYGPT
jgi:glycosyltransferase involved in cell wall biosynthesis